MLHRYSTKPIRVDEFSKLLHALFPGGGSLPPRLGLAVSGGVDSMALAHLLHLLRQQQQQQQQQQQGTLADQPTNPPPSITAYIIDHLARPTSTSEAHAVSKYLRNRYAFETEILTVQWPKSPHGSTKFELNARQHRYQLLCRACLKNSTQHLLVAHHMDDQAETVLMRLIGGTGRAGLSGIKPVSNIPECISIRSSERIKLYRPLLPVGKERLVETCVGEGVEWWEDPTNMEKTLTRRNAVRWILRSGTLPKALHRDRLVQLSRTMSAKTEREDKELEKHLRRASMKVDIVSGQAIVELPRKLGEMGDAMRRLLARIAELVAPLEKVEGKVIRDVVAEKIFVGGASAAFTAGGLRWEPVHPKRSKHTASKHKRSEGADDVEIVTWRLTRQTPVAAQPSPELTLNASSPDPTGSKTQYNEWHLFDNRFFLRRVSLPGADVGSSSPITIRLVKDGLKMAQKEIFSEKNPLPPVYFTIPDISQERIAQIVGKMIKDLTVEARVGVPIAYIGEKIVGLPSIGVWVGGTLRDGESVECMLRGQTRKGKGEDDVVSRDTGLKVVYSR
ncbi:PP-loop family-domain-containing protein [Peziza echinospora]|nr:PP-loop family-domain-containing protein [Peziza echinospora]